MERVLRKPREQEEALAKLHADARFADERRTQLLALVLLAVLVLVATVLNAGVMNVFLPGWWHLG